MMLWDFKHDLNRTEVRFPAEWGSGLQVVTGCLLSRLQPGRVHSVNWQAEKVPK